MVDVLLFWAKATIFVTFILFLEHKVSSRDKALKMRGQFVFSRADPFPKGEQTNSTKRHYLRVHQLLKYVFQLPCIFFSVILRQFLCSWSFLYNWYCKCAVSFCYYLLHIGLRYSVDVIIWIESEMRQTECLTQQAHNIVSTSIQY